MATRLLFNRPLICKYNRSLFSRSHNSATKYASTNMFRVQLLSEELQKQLFIPKLANEPRNVDIAFKHLEDQGLNVVNEVKPLPSADFALPPLIGSSIQQHFYNLGMGQIEPYYGRARELANATLPPKPTKWQRTAGWIRYDTINGKISKVPYPLEASIVFDTEVMYKVTQYPAIATAVSANAWYGWVSPDVIDGNSTFSSKALIPLGPTDSKGGNTGAHVVVGHNVGYDRARVKDEYSLDAPKRAYLDTFSLHVAGAGICHMQRPTWMKYDRGGIVDENDELFCEEGSMNSLENLSRFYLKEKLLKSEREMFATTSVDDINDNFQKLMTYCATDVETTTRIYSKALDAYFQKCPHPVSFAGIIHMGQSFIPVNRSWKRYIDQAETLYQDISQKLVEKLNVLANEALALKEEEYSKDPWLRHLDWSMPTIKMTKETHDKDGNLKKPSVPYRKNAAQIPVWYRGLLKGVDKDKKLQVGFRSRVAPYLLRLKWYGFPLYYSRAEGWCFRVGPDESTDNIPTNATPVQFYSKEGEELESNNDHDIEYEIGYDYETKPANPKKVYYDNYAARDTEENGAKYFRIPHKDGEKYKCGSPLAANFMASFEDNVLTSEIDFAREILQANLSLSYWTSSRERIRNQFVVWDMENTGAKSRKQSINIKDPGSYGAIRQEDEKELGIILPQMITMATVTRRAVEQTWLTASNPKEDRVGSELKAMVCAPPGYKIVGADVDSQELWICGVLGDAQFKAHGSTALGWMMLQGTKAAGTDMHSKTASILGVDRNKAKMFNYSRMYGAGTDFASNLLAQYSPAIGKLEANARAKQLFEQTKGTRMKHSKSYMNMRLWYGGSESYTFNSIEHIANNKPRTPVLHCEITEALNPHVTRFATSRYNWVVQSSGVDYLHLLLVAFSHLTHRHDIKARFMISLHDEVRYLAAEEDVDRAALALQIANLWTRSLFSARLGINNLPESVAFFSAVDIDHVMRKEVDIPCTTPSQPHAIPPGFSLDIFETLERTKPLMLGRQVQPDPLKRRVPPEHTDVSGSLMNPDPFVLTAQRCRSIDEIYEEVSKLPQHAARHRAWTEEEELLSNDPWEEVPFSSDSTPKDRGLENRNMTIRGSRPYSKAKQTTPSRSQRYRGGNMEDSMSST